MSGPNEIVYALACKTGRQKKKAAMVHGATGSIPRIARLMALAIRFEGLVRTGKIRDYAELAALGRVTRARMTQIMKLRSLAPDIQEEILFLPLTPGLNERNLRTIVSLIDWCEQRRRFQRIVGVPSSSL